MIRVRVRVRVRVTDNVSFCSTLVRVIGVIARVTLWLRVMI